MESGDQELYYLSNKFELDISSRIKQFNAKREPGSLMLKYKAMAESPFRFFRGTCHLFYKDLLKEYPFPHSPLTWLCGDLHIENFGSYRGGNRLVYFDMNDFDESVQGPPLFDISRLIVSAEIAAKAMLYSGEERKDMIASMVQRYRDTLVKCRSLAIERETATGLIKKLIISVAERKQKELLLDRTNNKPKNCKLLFCDRLLGLEKKEKEQLLQSFSKYCVNNYHKGYCVTDAGFRIAGTGSVGIRRYLLLLEKENNPRQKRLIDLKQALPSSVLNAGDFGVKQPPWQNDAERIIEVQQIMQYITPAYLSTFQFKDNWYVIKEIQPTADKVSFKQVARQPLQVEKYLSELGMLTASAHLRSSGRYHSSTADELKDFGEDQSWTSLLMEWTTYYSNQVTRDYYEYLRSFRDGYFNK